MTVGSELAEVTVADTVRWLHEEGLVRLAAVADQALRNFCAFTVDVRTGRVGAHPESGGEEGAEVTSLAADDLPHPVGSAQRLVIVGVTVAEEVLVVDLAATLALAINAERPALAARSWVLQLMLNPAVSVTTNSAEVVAGDNPRLRQSFIPGSGVTVVNIDDDRPPLTAITFNSAEDGPDHLDLEPDGTGEMYLGSRFWRLRHVLCVADEPWAELARQLDESPEEDE
ncbi:hypothetical protein [Nocardia asteroides]|uniref:hypothetical protein n=1 Tax=Nocardia asteroides TaxID=1824 RepID=UPI001E57D4DC|nr:hypothetical protein [Nocardia asteroides]UGT63355.1 hypothetical protein LTT61_08610 [Nocardia asteroides]